MLLLLNFIFYLMLESILSIFFLSKKNLFKTYREKKIKKIIEMKLLMQKYNLERNYSKYFIILTKS